MNVQLMMRELFRLQRDWKVNADGFDVVGEHNCSRNILKGIQMTIEIVKRYALTRDRRKAMAQELRQ